MALHTTLTERLGIRHPVLLAPMDLVADARLAAAVSDAGGLGLLGGGYGDEAWLRTELAALAGRRFGVGFITWSLARKPQLLALTLAARPAAVLLSFGDPAPFAAAIRASGAVLICQVQSLALAREAVAAGADILVAQGTEAGGHGASRGTLTLVPEIVDAFPGVPVVAAGGIADGRGLAAALMLGACGVLLGTRFYATTDAAGSAAAKERIRATDGDGTRRGLVFDIARANVWPGPFTGRCLDNRFAQHWSGREAALMQATAAGTTGYVAARAAQDFDTAAVIAGEACALIDDVPPAAAVVERIVADAERRLAAGARLPRSAAVPA